MKWLHPCLAFALLFAGGFIAFARLFTICLAPDVWPGPGTTWAGVIMLLLAAGMLRRLIEEG